MENKIYALLGLCQRAGKLVSGEFTVEQSVKKLKANFVIIAEDASENTKKLFRDKCSYRHIPFVEFGTKESLGKAIGKEMRASIAILDPGFSEKVKELLKQ